ncbi:integrating conjugative element membrane protein, PFL_4697 family [Delftia tsuruhatensis]|uniref:TIGR03747 family integrating conjugative element membrane protein n=1 Tax=Delftia tsuruhatensis TaxID=180282 RepID=UPI001E7CEA5C|nr:TIGR03747 family integrating conjugative element membrane protein [Delftia tsuruhatensis]CAB5670867.1 integrating conjugative element membrane protein, PFL_4697 family [Delftia tsuruhatensis]CAC9683097.1 integrating conjugative element membrane protein, PFL_4697 family [Delftia tsuruhatensis]
MSEPSVPAQRQANPRQGLLASLLAVPLKLLGMLLAALLISILVECIGLHLFWREQQWRHAQAMLDYELSHLSGHFKRSILVPEPGRTARQLSARGYDWLFIKSGLLNQLDRTAQQARSASQGSPRSFRQWLGLAYVWSENYLLAAAFTTLTFGVRLLILILTLPLLLLAAFVGLVDGLVRRDVRRFGAGRESGFIYHRAKAALAPLAVLPWVIYLALPISLHPLWVLLPSAAILGLAVNLTAGSFKKYL